MAIGHGGNWETVSGANSNPISVPVNPAISPIGGLVHLGHGQVPTDLVTGVTWGGVAMTRKVTVADTTGVADETRGRSYWYALEGNVPPGPQNVVVTRTGTALIHVAIWSQTGNTPMEVISTDTDAETSNPAVTLTRSGRASLAYLGIFSDVITPSNMNTPVGFSRGPDHDFGIYVTAVYREQTTSTTDRIHTVGFAAGNSALCGIVVAESVVAPPPATGSLHCCGPRCGLTAPDVRGDVTAHWNLAGGTPPTIQSAIARHGGQAYRFAPVGALSYLGHTLVLGQTQVWERFYVYFPGALPSTSCTLFRLGTVAGDAPGLGFRSGTQDIVGKFGSFLGMTTPHPVVPDRFYRIDVLADVSVNPRTIKMRVCEAAPQSDPWADGPSIDRGTGSLAQAASSFTEFRIGASTLGTTTGVVIIQDHHIGGGAAAYPFGPSTIVGAQPASDGVHSYNAVGDFRTATADLPLAATDAWSRLTGLLTDASSLLHAAGAATGEYLEMLAGSVPEMSAIRAVEMVSVHKGATATAHRQTLRWMKAAGSVDVYTDADFSELSLIQHSKHYLTLPDGTALTTANLNASKWRFASSFTAAIGGGQIAGLMMEIDGVLVGAPPPPPGSSEGNPIHIFPGPGTYTVALRVEDNHGLTDTEVQLVTVAGGVSTSLVTIELRESGTLRATRSYVPGEALATQQFVLTAPEKASIGNWNNLELWVIASAGTRPIRITRARLLFEAVAPPSPSQVTIELREGGTLRATRGYTPGETITTQQFALDAAEIASIGNWDNVEAWLIASGGARAIRVARFRVLTP